MKPNDEHLTVVRQEQISETRQPAPADDDKTRGDIMSDAISDDQIEIIQDFIQESRDMIDQLEPIIIELGQSCQGGNCWEIMDCTNSDCPRHGQDLQKPCWLDVGYLGEGLGTCLAASCAQDCLTCKVFRKTNGNQETMNAIFRLFHSMKGSASFLDLGHIASVAHAAESLLDLIRSGKIRMDPSHVELLCLACDFAKEALDLVETDFNDQGMAERAEAITARLKAAARLAQQLILDAGAPAAPAEYAADSVAPAPEAENCGVFEISPEMAERFVQEADELLQSTEQGLLAWAEAPGDQEPLSGLFRSMHSFKGNCGFFGLADLERLSHQMETLLQEARDAGGAGSGTLAETLLDMLDVLRVAVADISQGGEGRIDDLEKHLARLADLPPADDTLTSAEPSPPQEAPPQAPALRPATPTAKPPIAAQPGPGAAGKDPGANGAGTPGKGAIKRQDIRVDLEKLDRLINLIGEMVIAENMLIHNPDLEGLELENFHRAGQQMSKLVRELQEVAMIIRMIPVSGLFRRMIRLVHDLAVKSGKKVELKLSGEETELDKTVIETITDPLVHLLRNAMDHGLEPPEERRAAGKPEKGEVRLSARHEEGEVWITLEDDGRGLNRDKIIAKAISKGLIEGDGAELSDKAVANLIFQPGFSTADKVTDVSGRGVGMDVVKQNIEKIKGKIELQSTPGKGSRFILRIPLTLGIIDGMMVRVGDSRCIVPTLAIREAFRPLSEAITRTADGLEIVRVRDNFYPITRLHQILKKTPDSERLEDGILIVLEYQETGIALLVDEILGQQQTVIKGLSNFIGNVRWASGCTILGDGEVCLILDVGHIVEATEGTREAMAS
ncbi:chemotaxis protein CheA [Desulfuromonas versatilis]|uniref:chemotaxis protein CheA n=1 Tax=Desulfuromonas versatilis TaxID=2802975 RepID=UPI001CEDF7BE|nr:chemotaxis protein CheA [Desulfuromonas versatilis]